MEWTEEAHKAAVERRPSGQGVSERKRRMMWAAPHDLPPMQTTLAHPLYLAELKEGNAVLQDDKKNSNVPVVGDEMCPVSH